MPDHPIRLRGAWEIADPGDEAEAPRRVDLPTEWPTGPPRIIRLRRRFGRPPVEDASESIRLELRDVPGLVEARLNGSRLAGPAEPGGDWIIPLPGPLPARSVIELDVDLGIADRSPDGRGGRSRW